MKIVGDRYQLHKRQRMAVMRSACSDAAFGGGGWSYNDNRRGIALTGDCTPFDGYEVTISYTADSVEAQ